MASFGAGKAAGPRLIVTRPLAQATPWVEQLRQLGCDAQALPLIQIAALDDTAALQQRWLALRSAATSPGSEANSGGPPRLVMFVSANAVQHFFAAASGLQTSRASWPEGTLAGATGPGTRTALLQAGVMPVNIVEPAADAATLDSEALWKQLQQRQPKWQGQRVWVVRGGPGPKGEGRDWFAQTLQQQGAEVDLISAYRRCAPQLTEAEMALLADALYQPQSHVWLFSSSEAVAQLQELVAPAAIVPKDTMPTAAHTGAAERWRTSRAWAPHPRIVQAIRQAGFGQVQLVGNTPQAIAQHCSGA